MAGYPIRIAIATRDRKRYRAAPAKTRPRRSAAKNGGLPIAGYDNLTAKQVEGRLKRLSKPELRKLATHEARHKNRATVPKRIEALRVG